MRHLSTLTALFLAILVSTACGAGGSTPTGDLAYGTHPVPDGPGDLPGGGDPGGGGGGAPPTDALTGGILLTIDSSGETWRWWVTNPQTAQALVDIWNGTRTAYSFGGVLRGGPGAAGHNTPWSWHVDPEVCSIDGIPLPETPDTPSQCENQLTHWLATGVVFYPSNTVLRALDDRR